VSHRIRRVAMMLAILTSGSVLSVIAARPAAASGPDPRCATISPLATGGNDTYGFGADGTLWDWGLNWAGELGIGSTVAHTSPVHLTGLSSTVALASASANHALMVKSDGTVWAWGYNNHGQLGTGDTVSRSVPVQISGLGGVASVSAGDGSSFAIKRDGTVWGWGRNDYGQLGDGTTADRLVPIQISALTGFTAIAAGLTHTLALKSDGSVWSWGNEVEGDLGYAAGDVLVPTRVTSLTGVFTAVSAGTFHSSALRSDGTVWNWGEGLNGELGNGQFSDSTSPVEVLNSGGTGPLTGITGIADRGSYVLGIASDTSMWAWGYDGDGGLGNPGAASYQALPVQVRNSANTANLTGAVAANAGDASEALTSDGKVWTWGYNGDGAVGDGTTIDRATPFNVPGFTQAVPAVPTSLTAVAGNHLAYLTWSAPASVVTQYVITPYLDGVAQTPVSTGSPATTYSVTGLTQGASYTFTVAAQNCLGTGSATAQSTAVVPTGVQLDETGFKAEGFPIDDREGAKVNMFNGDLSVHAADLRIKGTGLDLAVDRTYHSMAGNSGVFGHNWTSTITDIGLAIQADQSAMFTGPGGYQVGFAHNANGTYTAPSGTDATLVKNADATFTLSWHASGVKWKFSSTGAVTSTVDQNGNTITFTHGGPGGAVSTVTDTHARVTTFSYNTSGLVSSVSDSTGRRGQYSYDSSQNLTAYLDAAGNTTRYTYDASHRITQVTSPAGRVVGFTYDGSSRVATVSFPLAPGAPTTRIAFNGASTTVTDADGHTTTYTFDPVGRTTKVTDGLGNATSLAYTSDSNVASFNQPRGGSSSFSYNSSNSLVAATAPTGAKTSLTYSDASHPFYPTDVTDPEGNSRTLAYDAKGNLTTETDQLPSQYQTTIAYTAKGEPASSTDADGHQTTYGYDSAGNLASITPPAPLGRITLGYDGLSRVTSKTDGKGNVTSYSYDALDRVTSTAYVDGTSVTRTYDRDGYLTGQSDSHGVSTMVYDAMGRLVQRTTPDGKTTSYAWDGAGNLTALTDAGGTTTYTYNAVNLPTRIADPSGIPVGVGYDANYNRTQVIRGPVTVTSTYDTTNRLTAIAAVNTQTHVTVLNDRYTYQQGTADSGIRQSMTDLAGNTTVYVYDPLNRLVEARTDTATGQQTSDYNYSYDGVGNRMTQSVALGSSPAVNTIYTYNGANELTTVGSTTYSYDANGNVTGTSGGSNFVYDSADRTTAIAIPGAAPALPQYLGDGQTERNAVGPVASAQSTEVVPPVTTTYQDGLLGITSEATAGLSTSYTRDPAGHLLAERTATNSYLYLADGLGSIVGLVDGTGAVAASYNYDPFGQPTTSTVSPGVINPWRFAGAYLDGTGLYKMGARYYDPTLGRWTQQDPVVSLVDPLNWNRYVYAGNDPVNFTDPSGLCGKRSGWSSFWHAALGAGEFVLGVAGIVYGFEEFAGIWAAEEAGVDIPVVTQLAKTWGAIITGTAGVYTSAGNLGAAVC
jgi:RHS repeat-associated protein